MTLKDEKDGTVEIEANHIKQIFVTKCYQEKLQSIQPIRYDPYGDSYGSSQRNKFIFKDIFHAEADKMFFNDFFSLWC